MNKKFKKICSMALTLAITATSVITATSTAGISVSAYTDISNFAGYTILDDKGVMCFNNEEYKVICDDMGRILKLTPFYNNAEFILSKDVNYEEANDRIIEIFKEIYPDNYLDVPITPPDLEPSEENNHIFQEYYDNYMKNHKPDLGSETVDGVTRYWLYDKAGVKESSKSFMEKLNDEKLISAFYDFGEVYYSDGVYTLGYLIYSLDEDIDLIYNYIDEHNIDCTIEKFEDGNTFILDFSNNVEYLEQFFIAADIYEETSIKPYMWEVLYSGGYGKFLGKNSLEDLTEEPTEPATEVTTTTTTTEKATEPTTTTTTTTTEKATEPTTTTTTTTGKATEATTTTTTTTEKATKPTTTTEATTSTTTSMPASSITSSTTEATSQTTAATTAITTTTNIIGDANGDNKLDIRDAAFIAQKLAKRKVEVNTEYKLESKTDELPEWADYNKDGSCDIRDAAAIARDLASKKIR